MMKHYRTKKRHMTLLELIISMSLALLIMTTLTYFYGNIERIGAEAERIQKANFQLRYVESRLTKILPNTLGEMIGDSPNAYFNFFTSSDLGLLAENNPSLVFLFQNGVLLNPDLANEALGRLYLDKQKRLSLATWPSPERWESLTANPPMHKEILLENVESLRFKFYVAPDRDRSIIKSNAKQSSNTDVMEPERKGEWVDEWKREYGHLPAMMKVFIKVKMPGKTEAEEIVFVYPLAYSRKLIVYEQ